MKRRSFLGSVAAIPLAPAFGASMSIAQNPGCRVIVDNDFAGDPDGLVALAHQVLSPKARTVLVTSSALDPKLAGMAGLAPSRTAAIGSRLAQELLQRLQLRRPPPVLTGSAAAQSIVAEAMREDPLPLFLTCGGPLTNVAAALKLNPAIAQRMTLVWIGGTSASAGGVEYNLATDLAAARVVFEESALPVWQVPAEEYRRFQVSVAELSAAFRPISPASQWLYDRYRQLPPFVQLGGSIVFGDSPMVSLTSFDAAASPYTTRTVRRLRDDCLYGEEVSGRQVRMMHSLDPRLNFADFIALLRLHARGA